MGAGASSTIELDEAKQFVSEWDARYEQRFMWAADSKGRVNRKAAERVLAKAERWSNFKARLPPESADTKAPVLPTCYIDANTASPTSIVTMSRSWNALLPVPAAVPLDAAAPVADAAASTLCPETTADAGPAGADSSAAPAQQSPLAAEVASGADTAVASAVAAEVDSMVARVLETAEAMTRAAATPEEATPEEAAPEEAAPEEAAPEEAAVADRLVKTAMGSAVARASEEAVPPARPKERKKSKMIALLEDGAVDVHGFEKNLEGRHARENLDFVLRARDYQALAESGAAADDLRRLAEEIRVLYVSESAPDLVSLPPKTARAFLARLDSNDCAADLCDDALHHVAGELSRTDLREFLVAERRRDREAELLRRDPKAREVRALLAEAPEGGPFRAFLDAEFASESYEFLDRTSAFAELFRAADVDEAAARAAADAIAARFLASGAEAPINVSHKRLAATLDAARGDRELSTSTFAAARVDVLRLLARDKLHRYRVSQQ